MQPSTHAAALAPPCLEFQTQHGQGLCQLTNNPSDPALLLWHMQFRVAPIARLHRLDDLGGHCRSPLNAVGVDPVMRAAGKAPISDRRCQRHLALMLSDPPLRGVKRRHDFARAPAAAQMRCGRVSPRNIQDARFQPIRNELDEFRPEVRCARHSAPSCTISPDPIE
jgi:hypothetical protein